MRWGVAVALVLTAVVVGSCADRAHEGGTLPPLASPSGSAPASPSAKPAGSDVDQIIALSKDYFAEANKALNSGDTARLRTLFTPDCSSCVAGVEYIEGQWKAGSVRAPNYYRVSQVTGASVTLPTGFTNVVYTTGQETQLDTSGRPVKVNPANPKPRALSVGFTKVDGVWKVSIVQKA